MKNRLICLLIILLVVLLSACEGDPSIPLYQLSTTQDSSWNNMTLEETNSVSGKEPDFEKTILNATAGEYIKLDDSSAETVRDLDNKIVQYFYQYNFASNKKQYTLGYELLENDLVATLEAYEKNGYFQGLSEKLNRCEVVTLINFAENLPGNYVKEFTLDDNKKIYRSYISFPIRYSGNASLGTEFPYYVGGDTLYELWLYWLYTPQKNEYVLYSWAEVIPDTRRITWFIPNEVIISDFTPYMKMHFDMVENLEYKGKIKPDDSLKNKSLNLMNGFFNALFVFSKGKDKTNDFNAITNCMTESCKKKFLSDYSKDYINAIKNSSSEAYLVETSSLIKTNMDCNINEYLDDLYNYYLIEDTYMLVIDGNDEQLEKYNLEKGTHKITVYYLLADNVINNNLLISNYQIVFDD